MSPCHAECDYYFYYYIFDLVVKLKIVEVQYAKAFFKVNVYPNKRLLVVSNVLYTIQFYAI